MKMNEYIQNVFNCNSYCRILLHVILKTTAFTAKPGKRQFPATTLKKVLLTQFFGQQFVMMPRTARATAPVDSRQSGLFEHP